MEAEAGENRLGRSVGSGDEPMPVAEPLTFPPDQPEDASMSDGAGVGGACEVGRAGSPPDASMPDGSGSGGGSAAAAPPAGDTPRAERASEQKRKEPCHRGPKERGPHGWVSSIQQATRNKATCRDCGYPFQGDKVRMSTLVNARGNRSCHSHIECIPGGLHPLGTLGHLTPPSHEQLANIEKVRLTKDRLGPTLPFARPPRTVMEATAVYSPAWWTTIKPGLACVSFTG